MNYIHMLYITTFFIIVHSVEPETCDETLNSFADATANFTSCAIANSRPITMCENCVETFIQVMESYDNMSKVSDGDTKCIEKFVNLDRLQITKTMFRNSQDLWNRAKCNECFQFVNSSLTPNISNETLQYDEYYLDLIKCINRTNGTNVCRTCLNQYVTLNDYYSSISNENERIGVCMDIVDLMNTTRRYWSEKCCEYRNHEENIFLAATVGIFFITALFYIVTYLFEEKKIPVILQQSRFAESLNHVNQDQDEEDSVDC